MPPRPEYAPEPQYNVANLLQPHEYTVTLESPDVLAARRCLDKASITGATGTVYQLHYRATVATFQQTLDLWQLAQNACALALMWLAMDPERSRRALVGNRQDPVDPGAGAAGVVISLAYSVIVRTLQDVLFAGDEARLNRVGMQENTLFYKLHSTLPFEVGAEFLPTEERFYYDKSLQTLRDRCPFLLTVQARADLATDLAANTAKRN